MLIDCLGIDKSSSAELSEAINSMYAWYAQCEICYVYMNDVLVDSLQRGDLARLLGEDLPNEGSENVDEVPSAFEIQSQFTMSR